MVGPKYKKRPVIFDVNNPWTYAPAAYLEDGDVNSIDTWWQRFGDETTNELVLQALKNNHDLGAAAARVLEAEAILAEISGQKLPSISYGLDFTRSKSSFNFGGGRISPLSTTWSQSFSITYVLDLFGKLRHNERAAWNDMLGVKENGKAVINSVISSVIISRTNIATLQRELGIAKANTENWQRNYELINRRYERGLVGPLDVRLARENLASSKAAKIRVKLSLIHARNAMDVLLGQRPGSGEKLPETLADLPDLSAVGVGIPASLLDRRPDVRSAELALKAANERIGVSVAQLYPDLTLSASYGRSADRFGDIFKPETEIYSAIMHLAQPIYMGGQLKARVRASKAKYAELAAIYAKTVLVAMREVEDALAKDQLLQERFEQLSKRFKEAEAAYAIANKRYMRGVEPMITVLETERRKRIAETELNLVKGNLWLGRIELFLALGGDWEVPVSDKAGEEEFRAITTIKKSAGGRKL